VLDEYIEPWLRGPVPGVHPVAGALLRSLQHAREDIVKATEGFTPEQLWLRPSGLPSLGFQLRHIAGSVDRLITYAQDRTLEPEQLADLKRESVPGAALPELFAAIDQSFARAEAIARSLDLSAPEVPRFIGRRRIAVPLAGLVIHIAEHTQRHTGQVVTTARLLRAL
jgi:uncharacterized damage-inducible protein DinB